MVKKKTIKHSEFDTSDSLSTTTINHSKTSWRYVIVFGSFCIHFVADGILFSFGILMHMIKDDLKIELHTVGIIASLFVSLPLFFAPLSSILVNKFGCRIIAMSGGLLGSIGLLCASLSGNFIGALIGIGVLCGIALSFVYIPAVVIVAHYFDENRAIATAIAVGGTGLGNAIVAQIIHKLNNYYDDWRDTTFFLSAILFTMVGFGALFRPVEYSITEKKKSSERTITDHRLPPSCMTSIEKLNRFIHTMDKQCASRQTNQSVSISTSNHGTNDLDLFDSYSADDIKEYNEIMNSHELNFYPLLKTQITIEEENSTQPHPILPNKQSLEVFYPENIPLKFLTLPRTSCPNIIQSCSYEESTTSISDVESNSIHRKGLSIIDTLRRILGLELFYDYRYVIFFLSQFLFYLFYDLIYLFPVDYGETVIGYSKKQMAFLVTILGFGQFFGQILFGLIANYSRINDLILYDIGAILCGFSSLLIPFVAESYIALILTILLFGLSISANYALTSVILANMCGLEQLTSAYGLILLGQGLSSLSGPVLGGWIAERYGYKISLIVAGLFMGVSGFVPLLIPLIKRLRNKEIDKNTKEQTIKTNTTTIRSDSFK